ncbi:MAG: MerR family transcriptional regulator, partial [Pseudomonadota bacterium]
FLREERLELVSENSNLILECERCVRAINSGRFCDNCKDNISKDFKREFGISKTTEASQTQQRSDGDKMFTATRRKYR